MRHRVLRALTALGMALGLLLTGALALTPEQLGELLKEYYVEEIPPEVWEEDTVEGMLRALGDPYTAYMDGEYYEAFAGTMADTRAVGIGVKGVWTEGVGIVLAAVFPGSSAEQGGLRADEVIVAVEGETLTGADGLRDALAARGEGDAISLTVRDEAGELREVELVMAEYVYPTAFLVKVRDNMAYLNVHTFGTVTYREAFEVITDERAADVAGWVLDLRDNTGGNVYPAAYLPGMFLGNMDQVVEADREGIMGGLGGETMYLEELNERGFMEVPAGAAEAYDDREALMGEDKFLLTLVNDMSASAAEVTATLVKRSGGVVIGERTYGKGVGQNLLDKNTHPDIFADDALKVTSMKLYNSTGTTTHILGVIPNLLVPGDLADEVAALMGAELDGGDTVELDVPGSDLVFFIPAGAFDRDPEAGGWLLAALPPDTACAYNGEALPVPALAERLGLAYESRWFTDVEGSRFEDELNTLATYGIVNGVGEGRYDGQAPMDRASLAALVVKAIGPRQRYTLFAPYPDVPFLSWYSDYVATVYEMGWMKGDDRGLFRPTDTMTHQEFFTMMTRVLQTLSYAAQEERAETPDRETLAADYPGWADWALEGVWQGESWYSWEEDMSQIDPLAPITREEAGAAIYRLLHSLDAI